MGQFFCGATSIFNMLWCCYCLYSSWRAEPQGSCYIALSKICKEKSRDGFQWLHQVVFPDFYLSNTKISRIKKSLPCLDTEEFCWFIYLLNSLVYSLQFIYLLHNTNGSMHLYQFIIIFGAATLFLAQMPSFHSLRHINLFSLILCLAYSACVAAGSIHIGKKNYQSLSYFSLNMPSCTQQCFIRKIQECTF